MSSEAPAQSGRGAWLGRLAIVMMVPVCLLLLEGGARLFDLEERASAELAIPGWIDPDQLARKAQLGRLADRPGDLRDFYQAYRPDRHLVYRLRENLSIPMVDILVDDWREELSWTLDTNEQGFRGPAPQPPDDDRYRIVFMGDSSTYGWGLESQETYAACLGRRLDEAYGPGRFEVLNYGVPGYNSFQGQVLLEREVLPLEPDAVLFAYGANDDVEVAVSARQKYERAMSWVGTTQAVLRRSRAYGALKAVLLRARGTRARFERAADGSVLVVSEDEYEETLEHVVGELEARGIDVVLVAQCMSRKRGGRYYRLRAVADHRGVPYVDVPQLYPWYRDRVEDDPKLLALRQRYRDIYGEQALAENPRLEHLLPDMCHPNALLAEIVSLHLLEAMRAELPGFRSHLARAP